MATPTSFLFAIVLLVGTCVAQYLPNDVTIRLTDDRYGYLCYKNDSQMLVFQGTTPCDPPTCFHADFGYKYRLNSTPYCLSAVGPKQQVVLAYCFNEAIDLFYDYVNMQLKEMGSGECLIPYTDGDVNVPVLRDTCIPSIQTEVINC